MDGIEEAIRRALVRDLEEGVLQQAPSWGKPLRIADGFMETPEPLRIGYKILKDAGCLPPEIEAFRQLAELREELARDQAKRAPSDLLLLKKRIADLEQHLTILREQCAAR
jgi:hypothetical protein